MMSDGTAHACPKEAVVPDEMPGDAADHRSFYASCRLGWAGRQTDNGKHRCCRNEHRLHEHLLKTDWIAYWPVEPPFDGHRNPATALKCVRAAIRANSARSANTPGACRRCYHRSIHRRAARCQIPDSVSPVDQILPMSCRT